MPIYNDFFALYDCLIRNIPRGCGSVMSSYASDSWTGIETSGGNLGIAMTTGGDSIAPMFPEGFTGKELRDAAQAVKSWNFREASYGMAAVNAFYNSPERLKKLGCAEPYENYCTRGLDLSDAVVGIIGHLKMPPEILNSFKEYYFIERAPQPGDYPDSACSMILPACDAVFITGSSLVNKTLPSLLELSKNAYTILTGPTVPMCPELLEYGINRLAGMAVTDRAGMVSAMEANTPCSPYPFGTPFLIEK